MQAGGDRPAHAPETGVRHAGFKPPRSATVRLADMPAPRIAVLTPDPANDVYAGSWPGVLGRLSAALAQTGAEITPTAWTNHADDGAGLAGFDLVLPLLTWG